MMQFKAKALMLTAALVVFIGEPLDLFPQTAGEKPEVLSRKEWNANKAVGQGKKHSITAITIHHTATVQKPSTPLPVKMRGLQAFSQRDDKLASGKAKPAWFDIPYHFYIAADGTIAEGRELEYAGDTNTEYDPTGHALIVLEGSFNTEQPSAAQVDSMKRLTLWLAKKYKVPAQKITGHGDHAKTACPGENLKKLLPELANFVEASLK